MDENSIDDFLLKTISQQPTIHLTEKVENNNKIAFSALQSYKYKGTTLLRDCTGSQHLITSTLWFSPLPVSKSQ